jgi:uncharacterized RDD family membrane protein YckC
MDWYYVDSGQSLGPIDQAELERLVRGGSITADTLVWHAGLADWQPYQTVAAAVTETAPLPVAAADAVCCECGRTFSQNEMIRYADSWICAACKPVFVQKLREGAPLSGATVYGGFWIRFLAKIVDGIILNIVNSVLLLAFIPIFSLGGDVEGSASILFIGQMLFGMMAGATYTTFFLGKYGATLGKMACGLKVVTADGGKVSYARALGRHFAEILSALTLNVGYIIAAFDEQKRTLHDHICYTRVIKK